MHNDYVEFNYTEGVLKKLMSNWSGVKKIYYNQILSIQKRNVNTVINGSIKLEVQGSVKNHSKKFNENLIHYVVKYQNEADEIYDFIDKKILEVQMGNTSNNTSVTEKVDPITKIKESKDLLDMGAISQEEFDMIKEKYLKKL